MYKKEKEVITEKITKDPMSYNLAIGGFGGNRIIDPNHRIHSKKHIDHMHLILKEKRETDIGFQKQVSEKQRIRAHKEWDSGARNIVKNWNFTGREHTKETKKIMSDKHKGIVSGNKNPMFGKIWITDGINNTIISKNDSIPIGWIKGRIFK